MIRVKKGDRFGKRIIIDFALSRSGKRRVKMLCDCGRVDEVAVSDLKTSKNCQSCANKINGKIRPRHLHPLCQTTIWRRWLAMKYRCKDKNNPIYGGRGITVCERWYNFDNFYADMGDVPFVGAQLDRIDPDGNYEPGNCRWATRKENTNNRRISLGNRDKYVIISIKELNKLRGIV